MAVASCQYFSKVDWFENMVVLVSFFSQKKSLDRCSTIDSYCLAKFVAALEASLDARNSMGMGSSLDHFYLCSFALSSINMSN